MENPIVWALIATLGTWAVTAAGRGDGVPVPQAVAGGNEPHAGLLGRSHDRGELLVPAAARHWPARQSGRPAAVARCHTGLLLGAVFLWASDRVVTKGQQQTRGGEAGRIMSFSLSSRSRCTISRRGWLSAWPLGALQRGAAPEAVMGAISIAFGIGLQNFPEGAAVSMPLRREGAGRLRSFLARAGLGAG